MQAVASGYARRLWAFVKPKTRRSHLTYIDGARAVAALYVVLHHCFQWLNTPPLPPNVSDTSAWSLTGWLGDGRFAVSAFIAISGFSLMLPVLRGDRRLPWSAWEFFKRRARRILPPYYFALGLSLLVILLLNGHYAGDAWLQSLPVTPRAVVDHLLLLHDIDSSAMYSINGPLWSIALEWHIYFAFPLLVLLARRFGVPVLTATVSLLCWLGVTGLIFLDRTGIFASAHVAGQPLTQFIPGNLPLLVDYFGLFVLGMFGATLAYAPQPAWVALRKRIPWGLLTLVAAVGYVALLQFFGSLVQRFPRVYYVDVATALLVVIFFNWAASSERNPMRAVLGWRPLAAIGSFAYSIYLIHVPILGMIYAFIVYPLIYPALQPNRLIALILLIVVTVPIVLVLSYIFFLFCERPFLNPPGSARPSTARVPTAQVAPASVS